MVVVGLERSMRYLRTRAANEFVDGSNNLTRCHGTRSSERSATSRTSCFFRFLPRATRCWTAGEHASNLTDVWSITNKTTTELASRADPCHWSAPFNACLSGGYALRESSDICRPLRLPMGNDVNGITRVSSSSSSKCNAQPRVFLLSANIRCRAVAIAKSSCTISRCTFANRLMQFRARVSAKVTRYFLGNFPRGSLGGSNSARRCAPYRREMPSF